jgi:3-dehydroquinate dehydratase II
MPSSNPPAIIVINGPNLNMLGKREPEIYGHHTLEDVCRMLEDVAREYNIPLSFFQSNHEGEIVDRIQQAIEDSRGMIINPGAYTHTSVAIRDALAIYPHPAVEVHISNIHKREVFRTESMVAPIVTGTISGLGIEGYPLALRWLITHLAQ